MAALKAAKTEVRRRLKKAIMSLGESERHRQSVELCQKVIGKSRDQIIIISHHTAYGH